MNRFITDCRFSPGSADNWKKGSNPSAEALVKIADYFNTSVDFLLGREMPEQKSIISETGRMVNIILDLIKTHNVSEYEITKKLGLSSGIFSQWKQGKQKPSLDALMKIANYFNTSVDFLLGREIPEQKPMPADLQHIVNSWDYLDSDGKDFVMKALNGAKATMTKTGTKPAKSKKDVI